MQKQQLQKPQQTFNSGIVDIYEVENAAAPGGMPALRLKVPVMYALRFDERVVGYGRRMQGLQASMTIDRLFRCPRQESVNTKCIAIHKNVQYRIRQVQFPPDIYPPVMDLSLERVEPDAAYGI